MDPGRFTDSKCPCFKDRVCLAFQISSYVFSGISPNCFFIRSNIIIETSLNEEAMYNKLFILAVDTSDHKDYINPKYSDRTEWWEKGQKHGEK